MSARPSHSKIWGVPERIAAWAAGAGFGLSAILMLAYRAVGNGATGGLAFRAAMESAFVLIWPSAILMTGAQSTKGGAILFLLSAALNAAYFVFVSLSAYLLYGKLEKSFATASAQANVIPLRAYNAPKIARRFDSTHPLS
jgi:hypothetical protein